ncbi:MAG: hypothetical protein KDI13_00090 [Alphaproteobacteria bacterium]|nr:hypothetical protein [Alphaproteobacteria bacterium]
MAKPTEPPKTPEVPDWQQALDNAAHVMGGSMELLAVVVGSVTFVFAIMGALTYHKKGKSVVGGFMQGLFAGGVLMALLVLIAGVVNKAYMP